MIRNGHIFQYFIQSFESLTSTLESPKGKTKIKKQHPIRIFSKNIKTTKMKQINYLFHRTCPLNHLFE